MRQPDFNRVNKALYHIEAARKILESIKWENISMIQYTMRANALFNMETVVSYLKDMTNVQDNGK